MNSIVIARYKEDLSWVVHIPDDFEIFVHNKGDQITDPAVIAKVHHIVNRPNLGRESETYLHHMLSHRRGDGDFTVFTVGNPFEHSPDFLALLNNWRDWDDLQPLTCQWKPHENVPPPLVLRQYEGAHAGKLRIRPERFSLLTWAPLEFIDVGALGTGVDYRRAQGGLPDGTNIAAHFLGICDLPDLAAEAAQHALGVFCYGAVFAVRNERILALPTRSLEAMIHLSRGADCYGYVLERLWLHLFGAQFEVAQFPSVQFRPLAKVAAAA